ncbi:DUF3540 domain-containing protein [Roseomonas fluvialis]|uniref:DUF3540 domain-containing protein n=1 Tax=Roseomonas fluvialis TaxID=1750527 RepID=A0ABN6NZB8_9PROT|nr:DUF3540 domain-containing protein [Roseomonas fluvialis]BDG71415.1 hypothetical protein Rmf_13440 [Roseomonas fluvialis]
MNAVTPIAPLAGATTESARVIAQEGEAFTILRGPERETALRAFSCLVEPAAGDLVLIGRAEGQAFILAVLARRGAAPMRLAVPDGATIAAPQGRIAIEAGTFDLCADATSVTTRSMAVTAGQTDASFGRISLLAEAIETIAQRIIGRFRRSVRIVEESDQLRARHVDQRASGHMHLRGDAVTLQGSALVKLRADQIHLG